MLARQLHHHPAWTAADLAAELAAAAGRLELMRAENLSVAAAFDLSYQDLTAGQQRLFRRLGVHPGTDIDAYAAAALDGTDLATARRHLDGLYDQYLLAEPARGRYRLHDLLREHARALAFAGDPADADAAAGRLLDYYLHTAAAAGQHIATRSTAVGRAPPGEPPAVAPPLSTAGQASAWLDAERANLHAAAGYAAASGRPGHAIAIPAAISGFLFARGHWDQSAGLHQAALATARQAGDRAGQAGALNELGLLQRATGDYPAAAASHRRRWSCTAAWATGSARPAPWTIWAGCSSRPATTRPPPPATSRPSRCTATSVTGPARPWPSPIWAPCKRGPGTTRPPPPATSRRWACSATSATGSARPWPLSNLGIVQLRTGDYPAAAASLTQALGMFRDLGDRHGQASALSNLGDVQRLTGDYPAAAASLTSRRWACSATSATGGARPVPSAISAHCNR